MKVSSVVGGWVLLAVALGGSSCTRRVEPEPTPSASPPVAAYYPLAVGNRWTYVVNGREDKRVQVEITKEEGGFFHDSQGGQLTVDGFGIRDQKRYLLRTPIEAGRSWTNVVSVSSTERYRIIQAGAPCEAPAGSFQDCVRVESRNRVDASATLVNTLTFAPGVGLIRVEVMAERGDQRIPQTRLELASYQVKPGQG